MLLFNGASLRSLGSSRVSPVQKPPGQLQVTLRGTLGAHIHGSCMAWNGAEGTLRNLGISAQEEEQNAIFLVWRRLWDG